MKRAGSRHAVCTVCNPCKKQDSERTGPAFSSSCGICHWSWEVPSFLRSGIKQLRSSGFCLLRCGGSAPSHAGRAGRYALVPRGFWLRFTFPLRPLRFFVPGSLFFRHFPSAALFPSVFALPISPSLLPPALPVFLCRPAFPAFVHVHPEKCRPILPAPGTPSTLVFSGGLYDRSAFL